MMRNVISVMLLFHAGTRGVTAAPVPLVIQPGGAFDVSYQLSNGPSVATNLQITGDLTADVEITGGKITWLRYAGGNVAYSDATAETTLNLLFTTGRVRIETRGIVSSFTSNAGAGAIDLITGVIDNAGHRLVQDRGTITTRYLVGSSVVQQETRSLAQNPDNNPMVGTTTATAVLLADQGYKKRYRIDLNHARDETRYQPAPFAGATLQIREQGSFAATGEVTVPSDAFVQWSQINCGQTPQSFADRCARTGQPLILLYAFNTATGWSVPVTFDPANNRAIVTLPAGGLNAPVRLEYGASPAGPWAVLNRETSGVSIFNTGDSGMVNLVLPTGDSGFVRLALAD